MCPVFDAPLPAARTVNNYLPNLDEEIQRG
jgi:hypothetical protein